jgi:(S)-sulfolactate dehydrogenase
MSRIVIAEFMDEAAIARAFGGLDHHYDPTLVDRPEQLHAALADCEALIVRNRTQVRGALLEAAPRLTVIGRLGVGLDNIDLPACQARAIKVIPATGANDLAVAEYVISAALLLLRGAWLDSNAVAQGTWPRQRLIGHEIAGKTLGLVGFGAIARLTAAKAHALGMRVIAYDPHVAPDMVAAAGALSMALDPLLAEADIVSLHVPLTPDTRNIMDAARIGGMRRGGILINAARGGVVDETALVAALREGHLRGAALDVFDKEPVTAETGALFQGVPNLILTPHIAGVTEESNVRVSAVIADAVLAVLTAA